MDQNAAMKTFPDQFRKNDFFPLRSKVSDHRALQSLAVPPSYGVVVFACSTGNALDGGCRRGTLPL